MPVARTLSVLCAAAAWLALGCTEPVSVMPLDDDDDDDGGEYAPSSEMLNDPDLAIDFVADCADFWIAARDDEQGGFYSFVEQDGSVGDDRAKSLVGQSRDAYGFVRAFQLTGDPAYLDQAEHALAFLVTHGWDGEHGGWYFSTDEYGELTPLFGESWDPNTFKWSFVQHYALAGIAALCEATRADEPCDLLQDGIEVLDDHLWDPDPDRFGYHEQAELDWSQPDGKGFTPTVDAFTTHARTALLISGTDGRRTRLLELADNMSRHLAGNRDLPGVEFGFPEVFDADWNVDWSETTSQPGHVLKTAWCLADAHAVDPGAGYREDALGLVRDMLDGGGVDLFRGGPVYEVDWSTGQVTSDDKVYWVLEQGVTAGLSGYALADDPMDRDDLLRLADESLDFYMTYLVDPDLGETWSVVSRDGDEVLDAAKGDAFKGGYHSIELGYYTYLYGHLLYRAQPVTLYYRLAAGDTPRQITLDPLPMAPGSLVVTGVERDGQPFEAFDADSRTLHLEAGDAGVFRVTFQ